MNRVFSTSRVTLRVGEARHVKALAFARDSLVVYWRYVVAVSRFRMHFSTADAVSRHIGVVNIVSDERVMRLRPRHLGNGLSARQPVGSVSVVDVHPNVADSRRRKDALCRKPC